LYANPFTSQVHESKVGVVADVAHVKKFNANGASVTGQRLNPLLVLPAADEVVVEEMEPVIEVVVEAIGVLAPVF